MKCDRYSIYRSTRKLGRARSLFLCLRENKKLHVLYSRLPKISRTLPPPTMSSLYNTVRFPPRNLSVERDFQITKRHSISAYLFPEIISVPHPEPHSTPKSPPAAAPKRAAAAASGQITPHATKKSREFGLAITRYNKLKGRPGQSITSSHVIRNGPWSRTVYVSERHLVFFLAHLE